MSFPICKKRLSNDEYKLPTNHVRALFWENLRGFKCTLLDRLRKFKEYNGLLEIVSLKSF